MGPFETERLLLRAMETDDVPILRALIYGDREVWGSYSGIGDDPERLEREFVRHCHQAPNALLGRLAVVLKETGRPMGEAHLDPYVNLCNAIPGETPGPVNRVEVELAFAFGRKYWGHGYALEACWRLIEYAFEELKLPRLVSAVQPGNERSFALLRRLGFLLAPNQHPRNAGTWVCLLENPKNAVKSG